MTTFERTDAPFTASAPAERRTGGERAPDAAHPRPTGVRCASPSRAYSTGWRPAAYVPGSIDILRVSPRPFESCRCCSRVRLRQVERCIRQAVPGRDPRTRASVVAWAFRGGSQLARAALPQPVPGVHGVLEKCRPSPGPWPLPVDHQHRHLAFARRATDLARVVPRILSRAVRVDLRREIAILRECPVGGALRIRDRDGGALGVARRTALAGTPVHVGGHRCVGLGVLSGQPALAPSALRDWASWLRRVVRQSGTQD